MSHLDSELIMLRRRLAALEEQKRIEVEKESKERALPLKTLETLINEYEVMIPGKDRVQQERWSESRKKLRFLKPILDVLKNIQQRLEILEQR